jgi:NAD(P)-dependent dehydrogenase (short-subunit alcohol dehydrogenase family)
MAVSKAILITGCSTGIGRATAALLSAKGHNVYATARRIETLDGLDRCKKLALDVTDEGSMKAAVAAVEEAEGAVGVLVNNAGFGLHGAFEETPMAEIRRQFETNVFGSIHLTQMVLPGMRAQRWGRIVNVSSMGGKITFPGGAFYHATKHALEAMSDAMRFELRPFGIDVVVVEPGLIRTNFGKTATDTVGYADGPYRSFNENVSKTITGAYEGPMSRLSAGPEAVAKTIATAVTSRRPKTRYVVPFSIRTLLLLKRLLPDRAYDAVLRVQYKPPEKPR